MMKNDKKLERIANGFVLLIEFKEDEKLNNEINRIKPEIKGIEEIETAMNDTDAWFYIKESEFYDTVTVDLDVEPVQAINQLRKTRTVAIEKAVPLDSVVSSPLESVIKTILKVASMKIAKDESFTVQCEFKGDRLKTIENISSPDKLINRISNELCDELGLKYRDKNMDWIIQIEELGEDTGIAVCRPDEILMK